MPPALGTRAETGRGIFVGTVALSGLERRNRARTVDLSNQHRLQYNLRGVGAAQ